MGQEFRDFFPTPHTAYMARVAAVDDALEPTAFSTKTAILVYWERATDQVEITGAREEITRNIIMFDGEAALDGFTGDEATPTENDYIWLPGDDETDNTLARRMMNLGLFFEDDSTTRDHFELVI